MIVIPGKIPIHIHPFFWALAILIGWLNTMSIPGTFIWTGIIIFSVLVHELGHAFTSQLFGQTAVIELVSMGGMTRRSGPKLKYWQEFLVVLNGPLAGFILCICANIAFKHSSHDTLAAYILNVTYSVNLFWTLVNLLPILPLDGGHLLKIVLESFFGLKGVKIALFCSMLLAGGTAMVFFSLQAFLAGALFLILTFEGYRSWKESLAIKQQDQNLILQHLLREAEFELKNGYQDSAIEKLERLRNLSEYGMIFLNATQYLAGLYASHGESQKAYDLLYPHKTQISPESLKLLHELAYKTGQWKTAIHLGNQSYQNYPNYETALLNAFCCSLMGEARPAIGWLKCAIREGLPNPKVILNSREFDKIRNDPLFVGLKNQY